MDKRVFLYYLLRLRWGWLLMVLFFGAIFLDRDANILVLAMTPALCLAGFIWQELRNSDSLRVHQAMPVKNGFLRQFPFFICVGVPMVLLLLALLPWAVFRHVSGDAAFIENTIVPILLGSLMLLAAFGSLSVLIAGFSIYNYSAQSTMGAVVFLLVFMVLTLMDTIWSSPISRVPFVLLAIGLAGLCWWLSPMMGEAKRYRADFRCRPHAGAQSAERAWVEVLCSSPEGRALASGLQLMGIFGFVMGVVAMGIVKDTGIDSLCGLFVWATCFGAFGMVGQMAGSLRSMALLPLSSAQLAGKVMRSALLIISGVLLLIPIFVLIIDPHATMLPVIASVLYSVGIVFLSIAVLYRTGFIRAYAILTIVTGAVWFRFMLPEVAGLLPVVGWLDVLMGAAAVVLGSLAVRHALNYSAAYAAKKVPGCQV